MDLVSASTKFNQKNDKDNIDKIVYQGLKLTDHAFTVTKKYNFASDSEYYQYKFLRVYLAGKGCDGFNYGVQFDHKNDDDLCFYQADDDYKIGVICDKNSYEFIKGSTIDYVKENDRSGYVINNPFHKKYRGKFYKNSKWQDKLKAMKN